MPCRHCIKEYGGCCKFVFHDDFKLILLPSEVRRIASLSGKEAEEFIDAAPLSPYQREWFVTGPDRHDKLWSRLFHLWGQPTGFKGPCPFLTERGCPFQYRDKPFICQAYPLDFNITSDQLFRPTDSDCMVCERAKSDAELVSYFNDDWEGLRKRFRSFRRECIEMLNKFEGLRLRACVSEDKPAIMEIMKKTPEFLPVEVDVAKEVLDLHSNGGTQSGYHVIVAELGGRIVGWACYGPTPMTESTWDVYWMATDPEMKNRGIGSALLALTEEKIRQAGGRLAVIETSSKPIYENTRAFYVSRGWHTNNRIPDYYAMGDDLVIYTKIVGGTKGG